MREPLHVQQCPLTAVFQIFIRDPGVERQIVFVIRGVCGIRRDGVGKPAPILHRRRTLDIRRTSEHVRGLRTHGVVVHRIDNRRTGERN